MYRDHIVPRNAPRSHIVFVYGTLKRGQGNSRLLVGSTFLCEGKTYLPYVMYDGPFPKVATHQEVPRSPQNWKRTGRICGELWAVDDATLRRLDQLEGVPHHYRRDTTLVMPDPDSAFAGPVEAGIYIIQHPSAAEAMFPDAEGEHYWPAGSKPLKSLLQPATVTAGHEIARVIDGEEESNMDAVLERNPRALSHLMDEEDEEGDDAAEGDDTDAAGGAM